jgi:two-component system NarL family response regulator
MILTHNDREARICHALEQGARGYLLLGCSLKDLMDGLRSMHLGGIALGPLVAMRIADSMKQEALTRREEDILAHMMVGLSNKAIASKLALAVGTVKTHVKSILVKLDAVSRTEAAAIAQRRGLLQEECGRPHSLVGRLGGRPNIEDNAVTGLTVSRLSSATRPRSRRLVAGR